MAQDINVPEFAHGAAAIEGARDLSETEERLVLDEVQCQLWGSIGRKPCGTNTR